MTDHDHADVSTAPTTARDASASRTFPFTAIVDQEEMKRALVLNATETRNRG